MPYPYGRRDWQTKIDRAVGRTSRGAQQGRFPGARPVSEASSFVPTGGRPSIEFLGELHFIDTWDIETDADAVFSLSFIPLPYSWNVSCSWDLVNGADYVMSGRTLTIADPAVAFIGASPTYPKVLQVQYDYLVGSVPIDSTYFDLVLASTPLAYWRLGEASGSTMTDSSGNGRDGTYFNSPTLGEPSLLTADPDTAAHFADAAQEYGAIADAAWMDVTNVTAEAIVKPTLVTGTNRCFISRDQHSATSVFRLGLDTAGHLFFEFWNGSGYHTVTGGTALVALSTHHIAATYDGTDANVYLDGALDGTLSSSGSLVTGTAGMSVGRTADDANPNGNRWPEATIDEVAVYSTALSAVTIAAHSAAR